MDDLFSVRKHLVMSVYVTINQTDCKIDNDPEKHLTKTN